MEEKFEKCVEIKIAGSRGLLIHTIYVYHPRVFIILDKKVQLSIKTDGLCCSRSQYTLPRKAGVVLSYSTTCRIISSP